MICGARQRAALFCRQSLWLAVRAAMAAVLICAPIGPAYGAEGDLAAWLEMGSRYHLVPDLQLGVSGHFRMDSMLSRTESVMPEVELRYRPLKALRLGAGYRFMYKRDGDGEFENAHRAFFDVKVRWPIAWVGMWVRMRLQDNFEWTNKGRRKDTPSLRTALGVTYRAWDTMRPFLAGEHFLALDSLASVPTRKWRITMGTELPWSPLEWEVYYRLDIPVDDEDEDYIHIVGLSMFMDINDLLTP